MSPIIAGRFALERDAQRALEGLRQQGFAAEDLTAFFVDPTARDSRDARGSVRAPLPIVTRAHNGTLGEIGGAAVGAGVSAEIATRQPSNVRAMCRPRQAGVLVAVRAPEYARRLIALNVLQAYGARDVERADGTWVAGKWIDFDPQTPPRLIDPPPACERWISRS